MNKKKHEILVHGWLSATTLDLLFHACLLALSHSGRHGRTTVCMYLLLLLWRCCCIAVGCGVATTAALVHEETEETKKTGNKYFEVIRRENENMDGRTRRTKKV